MNQNRVMTIFAIYLFHLAFAHAHFYDRKAEGWHWYETDDRDQMSEVKNPMAEAKNPSQAIQSLRQEAEKKLHTAILEPTEAHIIAYLKAQRQIYDLSFKFGESWQRTLVNYPEFDETLKFPVAQLGRRTYLQIEQEKKEQLIKTLSQQYGLFFFFRGDCPYCHKFAPIVGSFAQKYGWDVVAISVDGSTIETFGSTQQDHGMVAKLGINLYPTLLAYDIKSQKLIPICSGLISLQDIENRIELMMRGQQ